MQFDRTQIVIRERGLGEILDLALRVIASDPRSLGLTWLAGALPFALFNGWALLPAMKQLADTDEVVSYVVLSVLLVVIEMPWALLGVTAFVGQAMFDDEPRLSQVIVTLRQTFFPACGWLGFIRGAIPFAGLVTLTVRPGPLQAVSVVLLTVLGVFIAWVRIRRPFLPEIIVLERPPRRSDRSTEMTLTRRTQSLHVGYAGDGFFRFLALSGLAVLMVSCIYRTLCFLWETLVFDANRLWLFSVVLPLSLWLAAGYFAVVRFLSYIDLRVRREGWEVELLLRAAKAEVSDSGSQGEPVRPER